MEQNISEPLIEDGFIFAIDITRIVIAICGLTSNFLLFILFFKFPLMNTHANLFLFNLAITDTFSLFYDLFFITSRLYDESFTSSVPCAVESIGMVLPALSITQVCAIAGERCLFICVPLHYHDFMYRWKNVLILASWLVEKF